MGSIMTRRRLSLVSADTLPRIVQSAVHRSLRSPTTGSPTTGSPITGGPSDGELAARLARELVRAIRGGGRSVYGMSREDVLTELERANHGLVLAREQARAELDELRRRAGTHRAELIRARAAAARDDDGAGAAQEADAAQRLAQVFAIAERDGASAEELELRVRQLFTRTVRRERSRILDELGAEHDRRIDVLERRIAKLNATLERSEAAVRELAARKDVDEGLASIYRTVQGLGADEHDAEAKRLMLETLFLANLELRGALAGLDETPHSPMAG